MHENFFDWPLILKKSCKLFFFIPEPDYFQNEIFKKQITVASAASADAFQC